MSEKYLYLSFTPEALIFSMLPPQSFGKYLAIGDKKQSSSHAIFLEVDPEIEIEGMKIGTARERCVNHSDGTARRSAYVSIYRVLERVPLSALGDLHLATKDGLVLTLTKSEYSPAANQKRFLYQEVCPVSPRVVTTLEPLEFCRYVTNVENPLYIPKIAFADMKLGELAEDPEGGAVSNLPYPSINHLRSCLASLDAKPGKKTKIERRGMRPDIIFYMVQNGFYIGDQEDFLFYRMPDEELLLGQHNRWWNSAAKIDRY
ncbi:MAG TPA: hypothetical protein VJ952_07380 [Opitutales bacterium]|nr:hypothetical protein [Opitutales bacterium]